MFIVPEKGPEAPNPQFNFIFANTEMLAMSKPANVPMDGNHFPTTVEAWTTNYMQAHGIYDAEHESLKREGRRKKQLKFVHQLDYATSGVLCVAFSKDMASRLAHGFEMRTTQKAYLALVKGIVPDLNGDSAAKWVAGLNEQLVRDTIATMSGESRSEILEPPIQFSSGVDVVGSFLLSESDASVMSSSRERHVQSDDAHATFNAIRTSLLDVQAAGQRLLEINLPVGYDPSDPKQFRMAANGVGCRLATTYVHVLKRGTLPDSNSTEGHVVPVTKLLLIPRTGRRHQLRVHCLALGFPIVGDVTYTNCASTCDSEGTASEHNTGNDAASCSQGWPRMYLHAWRLCVPCRLDVLKTEATRVEAKKKRRRETLRLEDAAQEVQFTTEFVTEDPFPQLLPYDPEGGHLLN